MFQKLFPKAKLILNGVKPNSIHFKSAHVNVADVFARILSNREAKNEKDILEMRTDLMETTNFQVNEKNIDAMVLQYLTKHKNFKLAETYLDFLNENDKKMGMGAIGKIFKLYQVMRDDNYQCKMNEDAIIAKYIIDELKLRLY